MADRAVVGSETVLVRMAEMTVVEGDKRLKTTLGSCLGLFLHDPARKMTALAHVMLPSRTGSDTVAAKYVDTAIPALLAALRGRGSRREELRAFLTGGAHLFASSEDARIASVGTLNVEAARRCLAELEIEIVYEEVGGERGRTVVFDNLSGRIEVRVLKPASFGGKR